MGLYRRVVQMVVFAKRALKELIRAWKEMLKNMTILLKLLKGPIRTVILSTPESLIYPPSYNYKHGERDNTLRYY